MPCGSTRDVQLGPWFELQILATDLLQGTEKLPSLAEVMRAHGLIMLYRYCIALSLKAQKIKLRLFEGVHTTMTQNR